LNYKDILEAIKRRGAISVTVEHALNGIEYQDKPFVVIRHDLDPTTGLNGFEGKPDLCLPNIQKMIALESEYDIVSSSYLMAKKRYKENPCPYLISDTHEIGYHACTNDADEVIRNMKEYSEIDFKTIVPHSGSLEICQNPKITSIVKPLLSPDFQCQNDGYVADNGGHIRKMVKYDKQNTIWEDVDIIKHIETMEDGKVYHFLFHPIWWDDKLDFIGTGGRLRKISACIIVGNVFNVKDKYEDSFIKCLDSIKDAVDEIVVLHTDTREGIDSIVNRYPNATYFQNIYTQETWDFAEARNKCIELSTVSPDDWVLIIDSDEYLDQADIRKMRHICNIDEHDGIQFQVLSDLPNNKSMVNSPRLFRRKIAGYKDIIHNQPIWEGMTVITNLRIYHTGYSLTEEEMAIKWKRTETLLLRQLESQPEYWYAWMNLARIYRCQKRYDELVALCEYKLSQFEFNLDTECAWTGLMIDLMFGKSCAGKENEVIEIGKRLLEKSPKCLDAHQFIAGAYLAENQLDNAIEHFRKHIELATLYNEGKIFSKSTMDTIQNIDQSWNNIGTAYSHKENYAEAKKCYEKAIEIGGHIQMYDKNLMITNQLLTGVIDTPEIELPEKKLKILMVQPFTCIRNIKMSRALRSAGHTVDLAYLNGKPSDFYHLKDEEIYDHIYQIGDIGQFQKFASQYDIIHSHNEPDILTVALLTHGAVIHDCHDPVSLRSLEKDTQTTDLYELLANTGANGRIYVSDEMMAYAKARYDIDLDKSMVISNYVSEDDIPKANEFKTKLSSLDGEYHIVYEGGVGTHHRDYHTLFSALADAHIHVHIYPTTYNPEYVEWAKSSSYLHYYEPILPTEIIKEMTQYDAGIVAFTINEKNRAFLDIAICNKFYEYLAAGLPVISCNTKALKSELERLNCGIIYDTPDDIIENIETLKNIDVSNIPPFTMESQVPKIIEFYNKIRGTGQLMQVDPVSIGKQFLFEINKREYAQSISSKADMNTRPVEYSFVFKMLNEIEPNEIIDVGTGTSALPALMRHSGFIVHAVDNFKDYWTEGVLNRHWLIQQVDIHDPKEIAGNTDVFTCISALEHMRDPDLAISKMMKLLRVGGHLILTFPYNETDYIKNVYKLPEAGYGQNYPYPCHVFNDDSIIKWCKNNGGELIQAEYYQCFTGKYWTMGTKIKPELSNFDSHLACICIKKIQEVITRDDQLAEERFKGDLSYQVYHNQVEWDEPTRENIKKRINRIVELSQGHVLDIGCSDGLTTILIAEKGLNVIGIDMLQEHIDRANANLKKASDKAQKKAYFTQGWAEELKYFDDTFDTVILGEVLEHVVDTDKVLSEIRRVLKPLGLALISVPIGENAVRSHKRFFTEETLKELLSGYFKINRIEVFGTQMLAVCEKDIQTGKEGLT